MLYFVDDVRKRLRWTRFKFIHLFAVLSIYLFTLCIRQERQLVCLLAWLSFTLLSQHLVRTTEIFLHDFSQDGDNGKMSELLSSQTTWRRNTGIVGHSYMHDMAAFMHCIVPQTGCVVITPRRISLILRNGFDKFDLKFTCLLF